MKKLIILLLFGVAGATETFTLDVITNNDLTQELIDAKARGVKVKVIVDNFKIDQLAKLSKNGIETKSYKGTIDSFSIINGKCVIQNSLSVCDPILVENYQNQFNDYWNKSSNFVVVKNAK